MLHNLPSFQKKTEHVTVDVWIPHAQYCSYVKSYTNGVLQRRYEKFIRLYDRRNEEVRLGEEKERRNLPLETILSWYRIPTFGRTREGKELSDNFRPPRANRQKATKIGMFPVSTMPTYTTWTKN